MTDKLSKERILSHFANNDLHNLNIIYYDETDSTNTRAKLFAKDGGRAPAIFIADKQSAGRGRLGRAFESRGGVGLYITFLIDSRGSVPDTVRLTAETAVRARRAIKRVSGIDPEVKWVNDLYKNEKKLAGILCEGVISPEGEILSVCIGIGINVYKRKFSDSLSGIATSIEDAGGIISSRAALCAALIEEMLSPADKDELLSEYRERCMLYNREVTVLSAGEPYSATVLGITDDYQLMVKHRGETKLLSSGEVSLKL